MVDSMKRQIISLANKPVRPLAEILRDEVPGLDHTTMEKLAWQGSIWQGNQRLRRLDLVPDHGKNAPDLSLWNTQYPIEEYVLDPRLIIHEDEWLMVVWKPAGLNTCQSVYSDLDCLTWGVQNHLRQTGSSHDLNTINRLDRDTQGLVLYGKDKHTEKKLYQLFMDRKIHKRYLAVCPDFPDSPVHVHVQDSFEYQGKTQDAETALRFLTSVDGFQYWLAMPYTGRTHQIRKHFLRYLRPLVGDSVYGGAPAPELMLACIGYRFIHPSTRERFRISTWPRHWPLFNAKQ